MTKRIDLTLILNVEYNEDYETLLDDGKTYTISHPSQWDFSRVLSAPTEGVIVNAVVSGWEDRTEERENNDDTTTELP